MQKQKKNWLLHLVQCEYTNKQKLRLADFKEARSKWLFGNICSFLHSETTETILSIPCYEAIIIIHNKGLV